MKKGLSIVLAIVLVLSLTLTGCGTGSSSTSGKKATKTTLSLWTFVGVHADFYKAAAESWNKENPNEQIELQATTYPYTDMHNKLQVALKSGVGAPDIVDIEVGQFPNFLKGTIQLADLNDVIAKDKAKFVKSRLDLYSKDGKLYGMPTHVGATVAYYNKDILDKAGVDASKIKTWDDFREAGKLVKQKTGKYMLYISQSAAWEFNLMVGQQGSDIFDKDGKCILGDDASVKALQLLHDMIYVDKIAAVAPGGQPDVDEAYGSINKGDAATVIMPFWYSSRYVEHMTNLKGKVVVYAPPVFTGENKYLSVGGGGTGTAVPKQGKNVKLAKKFLYYAKGTENGNLNIWTKLGFDPPRTDVWEKISKNIGDNKFTQYFANGKDLFNILLPIKDKIYSPRSIEMSPTANDLLENQAFYKVLKQNTDKPETALKAVADEVNKKAANK